MAKLINKIKSNPILATQIFAIIISTIIVGLGTILLIFNPIVNFTIRAIIIAIIVVLLMVSIGLHLLFKNKNMKKAIIGTIVFSFILTAFVGYLDYIFIRAIYTLNNISVTTDDYIISYIYVVKDSEIESVNDLEGKTIGLQSEDTVTTNQMIIEGLEDKKISEDSYSQEIFSNYYLAANALLVDGSIDAIALDESAITMIKENYDEDFLSKVTLLTTFKKQQDTSVEASSVDTATEPFVVLISGVDTRTGDLNQAANSDVIMLAAFNPETLKLSLISIPRDSYLPVTCRGGYDKITHSGSGGISCTVASLEQAFDIEINYYLKVNFAAVIDIVNDLGGIEVDVPFTFCEQNASSEADAICLNTGYQTLDGEQALALTRHRKTLPRGDIDRGANQQLVIQAMINKLASGKIVTSVDKLLTTLGDNVQTNMSTSDMYGLFSLLSTITTNSIYGDASALQINSSTISGYDNYMYTAWAGAELYYFVPYDSSMSAVTTEINRVLGNESYPLPTSDFAFNANVPFDDYTLADPISDTSDTTSTVPLLDDEDDEEVTNTVSISSTYDTYNHVLGDSTPSQSSIINALGIKAVNQNNRSLDITLSTSNVNWSKEGTYTITATASYQGVSESKSYSVVVYTVATEEPEPEPTVPDSVTITASTRSASYDLVNGALSESAIKSLFGLSATNQNGESATIQLSSVPSTIGSHTITATAHYRNASSDPIQLTLVISDTSQVVEEETPTPTP